MNILPPATRARREGLDGVAGLFMRDRAGTKQVPGRLAAPNGTRI